MERAKRLGLHPPPPEPKTEEGVSFSPPPPPIGNPGKDPEPPKPTRSKKEEKVDEIEELKQLVAAFFYGIAAATGTPEYKFSEPECEAVAKPLSRVLARHARVRKVVQQVADPIAVMGAIAFPLMVKHAAAGNRKRTPIMREAPTAPVVDVATQKVDGPPPPPSRNGVTPFDGTLMRISEGS